MVEILIITFFIIWGYDNFCSEPMTNGKLDSIKDTKDSLSKKDLFILSRIYNNILLLKSCDTVTTLERG